MTLTTRRVAHYRKSVKTLPCLQWNALQERNCFRIQWSKALRSINKSSCQRCINKFKHKTVRQQLWPVTHASLAEKRKINATGRQHACQCQVRVPDERNESGCGHAAEQGGRLHGVRGAKEDAAQFPADSGRKRKWQLGNQTHQDRPEKTQVSSEI